MQTSCWEVYKKFIWFFCINWTTTVKWYDVIELNAETLTVTVLWTEYFDMNNDQLFLEDADTITVWACWSWGGGEGWCCDPINTENKITSLNDDTLNIVGGTYRAITIAAEEGTVSITVGTDTIVISADWVITSISYSNDSGFLLSDIEVTVDANSTALILTVL